MALQEFSNSPFCRCVYDSKEDAVYWVRWVESLPRERRAVPTLVVGSGTALIAAILLAYLAMEGWSFWSLLLLDLLFWIPIIWLSVRNERRFSRVARKWDKIVLHRARGRQLRELLENTKMQSIFDRYDYGKSLRYYWIFFLIWSLFFSIPLLSAVTSGAEVKTDEFWLSVPLWQATVYTLVLRPPMNRRLFVNRLKKMLADFDAQHTMYTANCAERIKALFPSAEETYEVHMAEYRSLILGVFAVETVTIPFVNEVMGKNETELYWNTCKLIEDMWLYGDDEVYDALRKSVLPHLAEEPFVWQRFTAGISENFYRDIYADILPESPRLYEQLEKNGLLVPERS